jgi:hypothetical protein
VVDIVRPELRAVQFQPFTFTLSLSRADSHSTYRWSGSQPPLLSAQSRLNGDIFYRIGTDDPVSLKDFQSAYRSTALPIADTVMKGIYDFYLPLFPETAFIGTGVQDSRVLNELVRALNTLNIGADLTSIKLLLSEYISSIKSGLLVITDNRKK